MPSSAVYTLFTEAAAQLIAAIPPGYVSTYGRIAAMAGNPRGARQVARILHSLSEKLYLPWHRVVGAHGRLSLPQGPGRDLQRQLLSDEGVEFRPDGSIDLDRYLWEG